MNFFATAEDSGAITSEEETQLIKNKNQSIDKLRFL